MHRASPSDIHQRASEYWAIAMAPAFKVFPSVRLSNFGETGWSSQHCHAPDPNNGLMNCLHGRGASAFGVQAPVYYDLWETFDCFHQGPGNGPHHALGGHTDDPDYCADEPSVAVTLNQLYGISGIQFTAFHVLKAVVAHARDLAAGGAPVSPWLTAKSWWIQQPHLVSDFWEERILQLGVVGCAHFFLWNLWEEPMYTAVIDTHEEYEIMSAMLSQLDEVLGDAASDSRRPVPDRPRYTDGFLLSGTDRQGSDRVWRLSIRTNCTTYADSAPPGCRQSPLRSRKDDSKQLVLGPVEFDASGVGTGAPLLCELSFERGRIKNATAVFGRRAPFGVWILQPTSASVALRCPGRAAVPWPLAGHALRSSGRSHGLSYKTDDVVGGLCAPLRNVNCVGEDLKSAGQVKSSAICCQKCAAQTGCKAWTWNRPPADMQCWLKRSCAGRSTDPNAISGDSGAADTSLTTVLLSPIYRGRMAKGGCKAIKLRAHTNFPQHYGIQLELVATLSRRRGGAVVETTTVGAPLESVVDLAFKASPESLDAGNYIVSCSLRNASSGSVLDKTSHNVTRVADSAPEPTAWIDEHHRLIYKGKPKFVLGLYESWIPDDPGDPGWSTPADDIDMIRNSSFNVIMPYWVRTSV